MNIIYSFGLDLLESDNNVVTHLFYSQGANNYGQLGVGHTDDIIKPSIPCQLQDDRTVAIKQVTGGGGHTVILTGK